MTKKEFVLQLNTEFKLLSTEIFEEDKNDFKSANYSAYLGKMIGLIQLKRELLVCQDEDWSETKQFCFEVKLKRPNEIIY